MNQGQVTQLVSEEAIEQVKDLKKAMNEAFSAFEKFISDSNGFATLISGHTTTMKQFTTAVQEYVLASQHLAENKKGYETLLKRIEAAEKAAAQAQEAATKAEKAKSEAMQQATKSINEANDALDKFQKNTKDATKDTDNLNKELAKGSSWARTFQNAFRYLVVGQAIRNTQQVMQQTIKHWYELNKQVEFNASTLAGILGTTTDKVHGLTMEARALSTELGISVQKVQELQIVLARMGFARTELSELAKVSSDFAIAMNTSAESAASVVGYIARSYKIATDDIRETMDLVTKATTMSAMNFNYIQTSVSIVFGVARAFNIELKELLALLGVMANAGFDASRGATAVRNIILNMADANGKLARSLGGVYNTLDEMLPALNQLRKQGIDLAQTLELTDKRSVAAFNNLLNNVDAVYKLRDALEDVGGTLEFMRTNRLDTLHGSTEKMKTAWDNLLLTFGNTGNIRKLIDIIGEWLNTLSQTFAQQDLFFDPSSPSFANIEVIQAFGDQYGGLVKEYKDNIEENTKLLTDAQEKNAKLLEQAWEEYWKSIGKAGAAGVEYDTIFAGFKDYLETYKTASGETVTSIEELQLEQTKRLIENQRFAQKEFTEAIIEGMQTSGRGGIFRRTSIADQLGMSDADIQELRSKLQVSKDILKTLGEAIPNRDFSNADELVRLLATRIFDTSKTFITFEEALKRANLQLFNFKLLSQEYNQQFGVVDVTAKKLIDTWNELTSQKNKTVFTVPSNNKAELDRIQRAREEWERKERDAAMKQQAELLKIEQDGYKRRAQEHDIAYVDRLAAVDDYVEQSRRIIELDRQAGQARLIEQYQKDFPGATREQAMGATVEQRSLQEQQAQTAMNKVMEEGLRMKQKIFNDFAKDMQDSARTEVENRRLIVTTEEKKALNEASDLYGQGKMNYQEYQSEQNRIARRYAKEREDIELSVLQDVLNALKRDNPEFAGEIAAVLTHLQENNLINLERDLEQLSQQFQGDVSIYLRVYRDLLRIQRQVEAGQIDLDTQLKERIGRTLEQYSLNTNLRSKIAQTDWSTVFSGGGFQPKMTSEGELDDAYVKKMENRIGVAEYVWSTITDIMNKYYDQELQRIEELWRKEKEYYDERKKTIEDSVDAELISREFAAERKRVIDAEEAIAQKKYEAERRRVQMEQLKWQKASMMMQAVVAGAQAVIMSMTSFPPPLSFIMAGVTAALVATQIAMISRQKIPSYAKGTDYHKGGLARMGEVGKSEMIITPSGSIYKTPNREHYAYMEKGTKVLPDFDAALKNMSGVPELYSNGSGNHFIYVYDSRQRELIEQSNSQLKQMNSSVRALRANSIYAMKQERRKRVFAQW